MKSLFLAVVGSATLAAGAVGVAMAQSDNLSFSAGVCKATDGDTVNCGGTRVRLAEIDAPEMPGHCRRGRVCAPGDPHASKRSLENFLSGVDVTVVPLGKDRYQRVIGDVRVGNHSASCHQVKTGNAIVQLKWADYGIIRAECP